MDKKKIHAEEDGNLQQRVCELEKRIEKLERKTTVISYNYGKVDLQRLIKFLPEIIRRYSG